MPKWSQLRILVEELYSETKISPRTDYRRGALNVLAELLDRIEEEAWSEGEETEDGI